MTNSLLRVYKLHEEFSIYERIIPILTMCLYYRMDSAVLVDAGCRVVSMDICSRMVEFAQRNKQFLINQGGQRFYSWGNDLSSRYTIVEIEGPFKTEVVQTLAQNRIGNSRSKFCSVSKQGVLGPDEAVTVDSKCTCQYFLG